jgi:putative GTP pyrophosphokinase
MLDKLEFLSKYGIDRDFLASKYDWETIEEIVCDFESRQETLKKSLEGLLKVIAHSELPIYIKKRIKKPEHLAEKLIRKAKEKIKEPTFKRITLEDYLLRITDLIGIRIIHTFKDDWRVIHLELTKMFDSFYKKPEIYYRKGDDLSVFDEFVDSLNIKESTRNYRSAHYLVKWDGYIAELQVRTIFEEAWAEVDHSLVYPLKIGDELLRHYSNILNRIAGTGDEISTIMKQFALYQAKMHEEKNNIQSNLRAIQIILESSDIDSEKIQDILDLLASVQEEKNEMIPFRFFYDNIW